MRIKATTIVLLTIFMALLFSTVASGEAFVVVVNQEQPADSLTQREIQRMFLGKMKKWPGGPAVTVVLNTGDAVHALFSEQLLRKSPRQLSTYWRKNLYSGRSMLPLFVASSEEAKDYVATHPNAISYIAVTDLDDRVKPLEVRP